MASLISAPSVSRPVLPVRAEQALTQFLGTESSFRVVVAPLNGSNKFVHEAAGVHPRGPDRETTQLVLS